MDVYSPRASRRSPLCFLADMSIDQEQIILLKMIDVLVDLITLQQAKMQYKVGARISDGL